MSDDAKSRPATEQDVMNGDAVFFVPDGRSRIYDLGVRLPASARLSRDLDLGESGTLCNGTKITIIQAEIVDAKDVVIGFRVGAGEFVCALEELELET